jgi:small subunit ribosomal protein S17
MSHLDERRILRGKVVSDRMNKTVVVEVERLTLHPKYEKYIRRRKRFYAHDEKNDSRIGDIVEIQECRPLSRLKRWMVKRIVLRASDVGKSSKEAEVIKP